MSLRTPLGRVRGLGSAKEGVEHWWMQRVTAVAAAILVIWFVISVLSMLGANHADFKDWLSCPVTASLMICFLVAVFYHAALGLQVVIEDYIHKECVKVFLLISMKLGCTFLAVLSVVSVLKIAIGA